jgi:hypothetical protein
VFAIQTLLHWHSILLQLLPPRLSKLLVKEIPEHPDIQPLFAPHRRVLIFVLKGGVEARLHPVTGASIADAGLSYPAWIEFELIFAAKRTLKFRARHGAGAVVIDRADDGLYVDIAMWRCRFMSSLLLLCVEAMMSDGRNLLGLRLKVEWGTDLLACLFVK